MKPGTRERGRAERERTWSGRRSVAGGREPKIGLLVRRPLQPVPALAAPARRQRHPTRAARPAGTPLAARLRRGRTGQAGQSLVLVAVLLTFVLLGFLGFAVDLGRLYLIRGELHTAAEQMALAAAQELVGTNAAGANAQAAIAALQSQGNDNRFNFGASAIGGGGEGQPAAQIGDLELFATYADALGTEASGGAAAGEADARYVRVTVRAEAPLIFWRLLPTTGRAGTTLIQTAAVAGPSAPLCTVCGLEPLAVPPANFEDPVDFGFVRGLKYTFYSQCTGTPPPPLLAGTSALLQYTVLNRTFDESGLDPDQQLFRMLAGGLPAPSFPAAEASNLACPAIGGTELRLPQVSVAACTVTNRGVVARDVLCGLNARLNPAPHTACEPIADIDTLIQAFPADTNIDQIDDYLDYDGNRRRILTVAVVDALPFAAATTMTVLGFRQFLLEPDPDSTELNPGGPWGRFSAMYIGYPMPVQQGSFGACGVTQGPGKVVLH